MTVYIEYVLLNNFIIDYFLLKTAFTLTDVCPSEKRLLFCSFFSATFALIYPLLNIHSAILSAIKVCFGLLIVLEGSKYRSLREYFITCLMFFALTFLSGGTISGICSLLNLSENSFPVTFFTMFGVWGITKIALHMFTYLKNRKQTAKYIYKVKITVNKEECVAKGFLDTGNALFDGQIPCVVCNYKFAERFIRPDCSIGRVKVKTVNSTELKLAVKNVLIKIYISDKQNIISNVTLVVSKESVGDGYDLLLHPALIKENYERTIVDKTEKIS